MKKSVSTIKSEINGLHPLLDELFRKIPSLTRVERTHGTNEMGADFVFTKIDSLIGPQYVGVIAKVGHIRQNYTVLERQINECLVPRFYLSGKRKITLDEIWVVTTGRVTPTAKEKIHEQHKASKVQFIDGPTLNEWVKHYIPYYWGIEEKNLVKKKWDEIVPQLSEARKLQAQLIRSEKLSAIGQLITGIAHEMNDPLQAVIGYTDLIMAEIKSGKGPVDIQADLEIVMENAVRSQRIIENLMLFIRPDIFKMTPLDIKRVMGSAVDLLHYKIKKNAIIAFKFKFSRHLPSVVGNFQQLQMVFINFLNNACDAVKDSPRKKITFSAFRNNGKVRVEVSDSGKGIHRSDFDRIFVPLYTTDKNRTGLGLAVNKQIIEEHNGKIGFSSEASVGSVFWCELPIAVPEDDAQQEARTQEGHD